VCFLTLVASPRSYKPNSTALSKILRKKRPSVLFAAA
jgi:hypothetical protein